MKPALAMKSKPMFIRKAKTSCFFVSQMSRLVKRLIKIKLHEK